MTHGPETLQEDERTVEAAHGFDLSQLWLMPLLVLAHILAVFAGHADKLKAMRRRVKAMPEAWRDLIPGLLIAEWHIRSLTASGIEILLSGEELDIRDLIHQEAMPPGYQLPTPKSAWEAHRRMEAIARFHADPETFIRRQAQRLAQHIAQAGRVQATDPATTIFPPHTTTATTILSASRFAGEQQPRPTIRGPPRLDRALKIKVEPTPQPTPARTKRRARQNFSPFPQNVFLKCSDGSATASWLGS